MGTARASRAIRRGAITGPDSCAGCGLALRAAGPWRASPTLLAYLRCSIWRSAVDQLPRLWLRHAPLGRAGRLAPRLAAWPGRDNRGEDQAQHAGLVGPARALRAGRGCAVRLRLAGCVLRGLQLLRHDRALARAASHGPRAERLEGRRNRSAHLARLSCQRSRAVRGRREDDGLPPPALLGATL